MDLDNRLVKGLNKQGITKMTGIQEDCLNLHWKERILLHVQEPERARHLLFITGYNEEY